MKRISRISIFFFMVNIASLSASAATSDIVAWITSMKSVAYALGWIMLVILGIKWIIADSPNERADAKKGMIYVLIGLILVRAACSLLRLYCDTSSSALCAGPSGCGDFQCDPGVWC
ncbi:MAG: hypothetical protein GF416_04085 [Candidatus Altiarchaeales archaeon]|nr:hypothetical protein [Candidatus Altiarchaeales archaeon]MBD3416299.1 hypothetical protein [Candidatus Altiarchaeales archaeon]